MANYEMFDLLYFEFRGKLDDDNVVFTQKYVVGKEQICIHFLNEKKNDAGKCFDFLNKLLEKFACVSDWTPFYFKCFNAGNNIVLYQFISKTESEVPIFEHFCSLAISEGKNGLSKETRLGSIISFKY